MLKKRYIFWLVLLAMLAGLLLAYSNHFKNGFYFDDVHTIVNNKYIRSLSNIPKFFTDIATSSTMPRNRNYRPVVSTLNAIDYHIAGNKLNSFYFHLNIFFSYILILICLFFLFKDWFLNSLDTENRKTLNWLALLCVGYYAFLTANADTINYIIARSDLFSTLCIVFSLLLYVKEKSQKYLLYLIPFIIGLLTKGGVAIVVIPLIFFYELMIRRKISLWDALRLKENRNVFRSLLLTVPSLIVGIILIKINFSMRHLNNMQTFSGGLSIWDNFTTQFLIVVHYIGNFFLPINLSTDPDFFVVKGIFHIDKILCLLVIVLMHVLAIFLSSKKNWKPAAMGIIWYFVCLAPTSTFMPLAGQIANDHRTFLPYIGLIVAVFWSFYQLFRYLEAKNLNIKKIFIAFYFVVVSAYAFGAHQRNNVWSSNETLWRNVVLNSPKNPRGLMNYGLVLMEKGKYDSAETFYNKAIAMWPNWLYINVNMGILQHAIGNDKKAEYYFKHALEYGSYNPVSYYYYARYLYQKGEYAQSIELIKKGINVSPGDVDLQNLLKEVELTKKATAESSVKFWLQAVKKAPSHDNFINLSLAYYKIGLYQDCINACEEALKYNPKSSLAYNNIGSAYNQMKEWHKAVSSLKEAILLNPKNNYARNNLNFALIELSKADSARKILKEN